jgi:NAD(P)H-hydrate epimerase
MNVAINSWEVFSLRVEGNIMPHAYRMPLEPATSPKHYLLTAAQMRAAEAKLFQRTPSWEVMQLAGMEVANAIIKGFSPQPTAICCGPGNNGGDGFIVAQALLQAGWKVQVFAAKAPRDYSGDARNAALTYHGDWQPLSAFRGDGFGIIVDALFGIGLNQAISGEYVPLIARMQASRATVVAVDIPSGVNADTGEVMGCAVKADTTITFAAKKCGHVLFPGLTHIGKLVVADIGITPEDLAGIGIQQYENTKPIVPHPQAGDHKYTRGSVLVLGGAEMTGAARLSALAAARTGAGMVSIAAPASAYEIYAASLLSIIVKRMETTEDWREMLANVRVNAVCMGPGAGINAITSEALALALNSAHPLVLDADALTLLAEHETLRAALCARTGETCLTPHEGEYRRLANALGLDAHADKLTRARALAKALACNVILKGADTVIANAGGEAAINTNAPPWLATAGSGDVLAGMVASLAAQGMGMFAAACAGAWLHGEAGNKAGAGLMAEDLLEAIPALIN